MAKFKRRHLLLGGLAASITARLGVDGWRRRNEPQLSNLIQSYGDVGELIQNALEDEFENVAELVNLKQSVRLTPPQIPYDRRMSQLLALCCRLSTEQYVFGQYDPNYDGSIEVLPSYVSELADYTQVASFQGPETRIAQTINLKIPDVADMHGDGPLGRPFTRLSESTHEVIQRSVRVKRQDRVFMGFALVSNSQIILAFRGTQRKEEWLSDLLALPTAFVDPTTGETLGRVHSGFLRADQSIIDPSPYTALRNLNPSLPCFVTGHSLGAAIATLVAMQLALSIPDLRQQLQLYTYASPRVGDPEFAQKHSQLVPNSYRIFNMADMITMFPPLKLASPYTHVGQEWSFLSQQGDPMLNHRIDTYQYAVDGGYEKPLKAAENYTNLGVSWRRHRGR